MAVEERGETGYGSQQAETPNQMGLDEVIDTSLDGRNAGVFSVCATEFAPTSSNPASQRFSRRQFCRT